MRLAGLPLLCLPVRSGQIPVDEDLRYCREAVIDDATAIDASGQLSVTI